MDVISNYSFKIKNPKDKLDLTKYLPDKGDCILGVFNHIQTIYNSFQEIKDHPLPQAKCNTCSQNTTLKWIKIQDKSQHCNKCFYTLWSYQRLTCKPYTQIIRQQFPKVGVHSGYYSGCIKYACQMFKSYIAKVKDREKEVAKLRELVEAEKNPLQQAKLVSKLQRKTQGIKKLHFQKNILYFGSNNMIEFKKEGDQFMLGIANPNQLRNRIWIPLKLGKSEDYHTDHNKIKVIEESITNKEYRTTMPKIRMFNKKGHRTFELMYPKTIQSNSLTSPEEIMKLLQEKPHTPIIGLSFGVKKPITIAVKVSGKIVEKKTFGNASLFHWINRERNLRSRFMKKVSIKYKNQKAKKKRAIKRFYAKRGLKERQHIKYNTHKLTSEVVYHINKKYPGAIIVFRDAYGLKRITYPPLYRITLTRWNVARQQDMLEHKCLMRHLHVLKLKYAEHNRVKCSKCQNITLYPITNKKTGKVKMEPKSILTATLQHALLQQSFFKQKKHSLERKIQSLLAHPMLSNQLIKAGEELTRVKNAILEMDLIKFPQQFLCPSCKYQEDFYTNDAINMSSSLVLGP